MTCDATKGLSFKAYTEVGCNVENPDYEIAAKWGQCTKVGEDYIVITGASTLKAVAVTLVAFVGSQF